MDPDLYDEFGNYVGPDLESKDETNSEEEEGVGGGQEETGQSMAIVLHILYVVMYMTEGYIGDGDDVQLVVSDEETFRGAATSSSWWTGSGR